MACDRVCIVCVRCDLEDDAELEEPCCERSGDELLLILCAKLRFGLHEDKR